MGRLLLLVCIFLISCSKPHKNDNSHSTKNGKTLFERLPSEVTGIHFQNTLSPSDDFDVFRYRNFYNGGGVGIGDINNDGLPDVFLTANMGDNKLYLNKGHWKFEDITEKAGVKGLKIWSTGVSMADVNGDGWLDIYISNAGDVKGGRRENELFINNGDLTFTEKAKEFGLADKGFSTHAAFFDFDKDGDLDCYVLNNSYKPVSTLGYRNFRHIRDELGGHKLYRNDDGRFVDISEAAGIYGSVIGFGLGVTVGDLNQDSWQDIYVSNDFYERDYLYINNGKGGFDEKLEEYLGHISMFSMGADLADINNDGYPEIFSTDMLPQDDERLKRLTAFEAFDVYQLRIKNGYYHQFMRNMLQLNNKDGSFSEIGLLAGVAATDWSWGALIADFNNDQFKEIYVCNGIYKDLIDQDFIEYLGSKEQMRAALEGKKVDFKKFTNKMPSQKLSNFLFTRHSDLQYENVAEAWGLSEPSFSNGAAYGDMDNDGDLDLIVNNVNQELFVYKNNSNEVNKNNFLSLSFKGSSKNTFGLGAQVRAYVNSQIISYDHMPIRGFQSSMDYKMVIGLGKNLQVDSLVIAWPNNTVEVLKDVKANQHIQVSNANASPAQEEKTKTKPLFTAINTDSIQHIENNFNDFDTNRLLYHMQSTQGPAFAQADINNDGFDDIFMGGSVGMSGKILLQQPGYKFTLLNTHVFDADSASEDVQAVFFDADGDKDFDLYVVTGGSEHTVQSTNTLDRLYINTGIKNNEPVFIKAEGQLPLLYESGSCVKPADIDKDGDLDLFLGTRGHPSHYGKPCDQHILINDGKGNFTDATATLAPALKKLGMVTDAAWFDWDNNGYLDLIITGEWMPIILFSNDGVKLNHVKDLPALKHTEGWWNKIKGADLDNDGDTDFILGNLGLNSKFKPTPHSPLLLYVNDFDENGSVEPIFAFTKNDIVYPIPLRQDLIKQMNSLRKKFVYYKDYADKQMKQVFDEELLNDAIKLTFHEPHTSILINHGSKGFELKHLPIEAQFAPVFAIDVYDADHDGYLDIMLGGNLFAVKPEVGRYDAMHGLVLKNKGNATFKALHALQSGINLKGEVRHIAVINSKGKKTIAFIRNNDTVIFYKSNK